MLSLSKLFVGDLPAWPGCLCLIVSGRVQHTHLSCHLKHHRGCPNIENPPKLIMNPNTTKLSFPHFQLSHLLGCLREARLDSQIHIMYKRILGRSEFAMRAEISMLRQLRVFSYFLFLFVDKNWIQLKWYLTFTLLYIQSYISINCKISKLFLHSRDLWTSYYLVQYSHVLTIMLFF